MSNEMNCEMATLKAIIVVVVVVSFYWPPPLQELSHEFRFSFVYSVANLDFYVIFLHKYTQRVI